METSFHCVRTVEDAALDLLGAARALEDYRREADRIVSELDSRWAANRARRELSRPRRVAETEFSSCPCLTAKKEPRFP